MTYNVFGGTLNLALSVSIYLSTPSGAASVFLVYFEPRNKSAA